jgi:E3 ubiquitin-protein ligase MYCBP2
MMTCLTDRSTETFWESGDEDRNKTKVITASLIQGSSSSSEVKAKAIYIHIDNVRDSGAKCNSVVIKCSESGSDSFLKIRSHKVDGRFTGWIIALIPEVMTIKHLKMEFKGPDNSLRLRHITIMGSKRKSSNWVPVLTPFQQIHMNNCEAETLRVFRSLTSQVCASVSFLLTAGQ